MTTVKVERENGFVVRLFLKGHAGYAEEGEDVVCAAVSAISQTAVLGLKAAGVSLKMKRKDGFLDVRVEIPAERDPRLKAEAILDTAVLGLRDICEGYPAFVSMEE